MDTRLTPIRRFIADFQAYLVLCIVLVVLLVNFLMGDTATLGPANLVLYFCLALIVVIAAIGQYTAKNRERYLYSGKFVFFGEMGQKGVNRFARRLALKYVQSDFSEVAKKSYLSFASLAHRFGYKAPDIPEAALPR